MSTQVAALAEAIKEKGRRSTQELPPLLEQAERFARDERLDPPTRALAHRAAANALQLMNNFQPALANYDCAISILETAGSSEELGRTLHAKVGLLLFMSRFDEMFACAGRARALFEQLGDRHRLARLDVNLSHAYHRLDRFDLVLECAERALATLAEAGDREGYLAACLNSAVALTVMHQFEKAEQRYQAALDLSAELGLSSWTLHCRYNISYLRYLTGDTAAALQQIAALRTEYETAGEERHVCLCWLDEAEILLEVGELHTAIDAACIARRLGIKLGLNFEIGKSLLFEAVACLRLGRMTEAESLLDEATGRFQTDHNGVWTAAAKLQTALFQGEGGNAASLEHATAARALLQESGLPHRLALADVVIGRIHRAQGDLDSSISSFQSALVFAEKSRSEWMQFHAAYELGVSLSQKGSEDSFLLLQHAEKMLDSLWGRLGSDDLKLAFLNDRENVYSHLIGYALEHSTRSAFEFSEKARSRALRERLTADGGRLSHLQSRLAADEIVLEYFIHGDDLAIFWVTSEDLKCIRNRGAVQRIEDHHRNLERHFASCSVKWEKLGPAHNQLLQTAQHHLEALYDDLIAPVENALLQRVAIVPHGFLHGIPFHALANDQGFLMDRHEVAYSPSATLYCSAPDDGSFDAPVFVAFTRTNNMSSAEEIKEAAARFPSAVLLVDPSTTQLREAFKTPRELVHIAGHAGIDLIGGTISWIETAQGRLTGRDLAEMSIQARSIVITGCQTARRTILPGDEWQGLMRAFYLSGARTIVSAFWDIRDESARRFASEFYKSFNGGNAPAAVQAASSAVRRWRSHPYFWAGFGAFVRNGR